MHDTAAMELKLKCCKFNLLICTGHVGFGPDEYIYLDQRIKRLAHQDLVKVGWIHQPGWVHGPCICSTFFWLFLWLALDKTKI